MFSFGVCFEYEHFGFLRDKQMEMAMQTIFF